MSICSQSNKSKVQLSNGLCRNLHLLLEYFSTQPKVNICTAVPVISASSLAVLHLFLLASLLSFLTAVGTFLIFLCIFPHLEHRLSALHVGACSSCSVFYVSLGWFPGLWFPVFSMDFPGKTSPCRDAGQPLCKDDTVPHDAAGEAWRHSLKQTIGKAIPVSELRSKTTGADGENWPFLLYFFWIVPSPS